MTQCEEKTRESGPAPSPFDRLPEHVKARLIEKERHETLTAQAYKQKQLKRTIAVTIIGTVTYLVFGLVMAKSTVGLMVLHCLLGTAVSFLVSFKELGVIPSALGFGGTAIALSIVGFMLGKTDITGGFWGMGALAFFCSWLMFIGIGAFIGYWIENSD